MEHRNTGKIASWAFSRIADVFHLYGLNVNANIPLPELSTVESTGPECNFELLKPAVQKATGVAWLHHWYLPSGKLWRSSAKEQSGYLLRFHNLADFNISSSGDRITCSPIPDIPIETIRHLLLDQVIPLSLSLRGRETIHASSLLTPHGACGFVGETGFGKSTLLASFASAGRTLLADDCLALDDVDGQIVVFPGYPGLRLWPSAIKSLFGQTEHAEPVSHYNQKKRVPIASGSPITCCPVKALFVLAQSGPDSPDAIKVEAVPAAEALTELLKHSFRLDPTDRERLARQFKFFCRLLTQVPLYRLTYPRDFSRLPEVRQAILCALRASAV